MAHTLLLADDSVTVQRVIELTFADEDVRVVAVSDGDQAIAELDAHPPDIVLADVGMPGKNGYEVAAYMRQSPRLQHIPIVLLTGAFEPVDQERAAEAGCDGVLAKPFEPQQVIGRVRELLARSAKKDSANAAPAAPAARAAAADMFAAAAVNPAAPAAAAMPPAAAPATNDYFDKLDAAFATLTSAAAPKAPPLSDLPSSPPQAATGETDWFASPLNSPQAAAASGTEQWDLPGPAATNDAVDLPLTTFEEPSDAEDLNITETGAEVPRAAPEPVAPQHPAPQHPVAQPAAIERAAPEHPAPQYAAPQHPIALPSIADAFAAILAAEAHDPSAVAPVWPVAGGPMSAAAPPSVDIEDLVDRVTRRVIDRLGDAVIHDAVRDATSLIAERLVTEEIERIKSSIK